MMLAQTSPITRVLLLTLGATAATNAAIAETATIDNADSAWRAVSDCVAQPTEEARHTCLDDVLRRAGLLTPEIETQQQRERFGLKGDTRAPALPVAVTPSHSASETDPAPSAPSTPPAARSTPPAAPSTVEVELARISTTHDQKLILTTTDGALWRQIEGSVVLPLPVAGDRMTIRRASLGSYLCEVRRNVGFRCSRVR